MIKGTSTFSNRDLEGLTDIYESEHRLRTKSGEWKWILDRGKVLKRDENGKPLRALGTHLDITERKRIEERLHKENELVHEANRELKMAFEKEKKLRTTLAQAEKLASLGEMASKVAHEINNPLTVIKGQAEIQALKVSDKDLKRSLQMIKEKADQIKILTRGYMNLAKPDEAKLIKTRLGNVLKATLRTLIPLGQIKHIELREEYMENEPEIYGDPGRLEQVFRNLIINAADATSGTKIRRITVGTKLSDNNRSVDAYVVDSGVGIEHDDLDKIFEPYYTKKERAVGTGLGLVIVKETTEIIHGGKVEVKSRLGKGSEFHVLIPLTEYSQLKKKMLIVDDDRAIAQLLAQYLSQLFGNQRIKSPIPSI